MAPLSLTLLGSFRARLDGDQPLVIPIKKAQALLAYLALPLGQAHAREKLAALLWGDMRDALARAGLRQALFALRKALGASSPLRMVGETVGLDPASVVVDVAAFEQRVADGTPDALEDVAALYQGDLLEGLTLSEAPFEEWMLAERLRLREMAVEALGRLLAQQRESGAADAAIRTAVRLIGLDPLQEGVHRTLMRLHAQMGRRGAALRQYQLCVAALQRELRAEPDDETRALYQQILQRQSMTASPAPAVDSGAGPPPAEWLPAEGPAGETALVGREGEMRALRAALASALAGHGQVVAVLGEAGIGKSRLLAELVGEVSGKGARLLLGRCYETEQVLPFGPWINALRAGRVAADAETLERLGPVWRAELARLLPEIAPVTSPGPATPDPAQLFEGVAQLLERVASAHPVVLLFEDLHWADEMSLRLLAFAARRLHRCRLLIVGTVRDEDLAEAVLLRHTLDEIERDRRLARVSLAALSRADTAALARMLVSPSAAARLEVPVWTASLGNPFMVVETLRALGGGEPGDAPSLPLSDRVRDLIAHRLERLGERARRLLAVAAVVGRPFEFALLQRASDLDESTAAEGVEELVRHRALHGAGEGLEFTHDRIREVVYGELLPARRVILHRRVAEALEHLHADALERYALALGTHYREGEAWGPAVVHLVRSGRLASMRYANRDAIACYEEALGALAHLPEGRPTDEHAAELRFFFAHALFAAGQLERAKENFRLAESLAGALEDHRRLAQIHAGMTYLLGSEAAFEAATQSGVRAITIAASLGDLGLEVWAGIGLGRVYFGQGSYRAAIERMRRVAEALKDSPADERFGRGNSIMPSVACRAWLALGLGHVGEFEEAIAWGADGVRIADDVAGPTECTWVYYCVGAVHLERGDADLAAPFFERALPLCTDGRLPVYAPRVLAGLGAAHVARGRIDEGIALLEQAVRDVEATKMRYGHATILIQMGAAHLAAERLDEATAHARAALDLARAQGARGDEARALELHGALAERGSREDAAGALAGGEAAGALAREPRMAPRHAGGRLTLARLPRRLGHEGEAAREAAQGEPMLRAMRMEPPPIHMARSRE